MMLRKLAMAVPVLGAFALLTPGAHQPAQAAQFSPALDNGLTPLVELVGRRGGGGVWRGGGGGGGRSFGGGGRSFGGGGGGMWRGGGGGGRSFGGGGRNFGGFNRGSSGKAWAGRPGGWGGRPGWNRPGRPGWSGGPGRPGWSGGNWKGRHGHWRHHRHRHRFYGPGVGFYLSDSYYYDNDCAWLRERAVYTGSAYWWRRYRYCLDGVY
jgi:hypothetical protein